MEEKESKVLISKNDKEILAKKVILNRGINSNFNVNDITIEMHIYDLLDNKIASIHSIPKET
jgi:hypothetical protein